MTTYTLDHPQKGQIEYRDSKRYLWLLSLFMPTAPLLGIFLYFQSGSQWLLGIPLAILYLVLPFMDWALGSDTNNPPEEIVPQLDEDRYYRV
jgi:alkane 1-monooxygenase